MTNIDVQAPKEQEKTTVVVSSPKRRILVGLLVVVCLGVIGFSGWFGWQYWSDSRQSNKATTSNTTVSGANQIPAKWSEDNTSVLVGYKVDIPEGWTSTPKGTNQVEIKSADGKASVVVEKVYPIDGSTYSSVDDAYKQEVEKRKTADAKIGEPKLKDRSISIILVEGNQIQVEKISGAVFVITPGNSNIASVASARRIALTIVSAS